MVDDRTASPAVDRFVDVLGDPARLAVLGECGLGAHSDSGMEWFAERVRRWLRAPSALVSLVGAQEQVFPGVAGLGGPFAETRRTPLTHSFCRHVVATGGPVVVEDVREDPAALSADSAVRELGIVAYAGMPLTDEAGHVLGSLCAIDHDTRVWSTGELDALTDLAVACSAELRLRLARVEAARERARHDRLELSLRESFERSQTLLEVSRSVGDSTSVDDVRAGLTDVAGGVLGADHVAVLVVDGTQLRPLAPPDDEDRRWADIERDEDGPATVAVAQRRVVSCSTREQFDREFSPAARARLDALDLHAVVAAPVLDAGGPIGALVLGWRRPREFSPAELLLANTVAAYTARAIAHVGWVQHRVTVAREMQQAMLTDLPEVAGARFAARYEPADDREYVGGDWYDACALSDPHRPRDTVVAVSVGDIVGHELGAAITMGQVRSMLRQAAWDHASGTPSSAMHAFETANTGAGLDAAGTAIVAYLRRPPGGPWSVSWVNAGHPHPILVHPDGTTRLLDAHQRWFGLPKGLVGARRDQYMTVASGSTLVLYTDGVIERRGVDVDQRVDELREFLSARATAEPGSIGDAVVDEFGRGAADDVVVLALRLD